MVYCYVVSLKNEVVSLQLLTVVNSLSPSYLSILQKREVILE